MLVSIAQGYLFGLLIEKHRGQKGVEGLSDALDPCEPWAARLFQVCRFLPCQRQRRHGTFLPLLKLSLPIGISFYTFQVLSYVIDVYRGDTAAQRNFIDLAAYVSLFPSSSQARSCVTATLLCSSGSAHTAFPPRRKAYAASRSAFAKKILLANQFGALASAYQQTQQESVLSSGSMRSRFCFRSTLTFPVTATWPSALAAS